MIVMSSTCHDEDHKPYQPPREKKNLKMTTIEYNLFLCGGIARLLAIFAHDGNVSIVPLFN